MTPVIDKTEIDSEKIKVKERIDELINNLLPLYREEKSKHAAQGDLRENIEFDNAISNHNIVVGRMKGKELVEQISNYLEKLSAGDNVTIIPSSDELSSDIQSFDEVSEDRFGQSNPGRLGEQQSGFCSATSPAFEFNDGGYTPPETAEKKFEAEPVKLSNDEFDYFNEHAETDTQRDNKTKINGKSFIERIEDSPLESYESMEEFRKRLDKNAIYVRLLKESATYNDIATKLRLLEKHDLYMLAKNESDATAKEMLLSTAYYMMYSAFLYDYNTGSSVAVGSALGTAFWEDYFNFMDNHSAHWTAMVNQADGFFNELKISDGTAVSHSKTMISQILNGMASSKVSKSDKRELFEAFAEGLLGGASLPWQGSKAVAGTAEIIRWAYMVNTNSKRDTYISNIEKSLPSSISIPTDVKEILMKGIEYKVNQVFDFKADALAELGEAGSFLVAYLLPTTNYLTDLGFTETRLTHGKTKMEEKFPMSVKDILKEIADAIDAVQNGLDTVNDGVDKLKDSLGNVNVTLPNPVELVKSLLGGVTDDPSDVAGSGIDVIDISSGNADEGSDNITTINNFMPWWKNNNFKLRLNSR